MLPPIPGPKHTLLPLTWKVPFAFTVEHITHSSGIKINTAFSEKQSEVK